jgi:hypothetical protein
MLLVLALACAAPEEGPPAITIVSPADGSVVCGEPLEVTLAVSGLTLVPPESGDTTPGTGHVDVMLNGQDVAMTGTERFEVTGVPEGAYQLKVELSNADHTPVEPYAGDLVYIEVQADACAG